MKKRLFAVMIGIAMIVSTLIGCGNNGGDAGGGQAAAETQEADDTGAGDDDAAADVDDSDVVDADDTAGDDDTVEVADLGDVVVLDVFINFPWWPVDHFDGIIPEYITANTGVALNKMIATDDTQLGVMIAAGDLPDLVFSDAEVNRLSHRNVSMSYTELMENYGLELPDVRPVAVDIARGLSDDGDFYTILSHFSTREEWANLQMGAPGQAATFFRKDLLDSIGIDGSEIDSVERFMEVLAIVRDELPDHVPFGLGGHHKFNGVENMVGLPLSRFNEATGEYFYIATAPRYREFLEVANRMYREGFVTVEAFANESEADSHQHAFNDGAVFYAWHLNYANFARLQSETQNLHPHAEWSILPPLGDGILNAGRGWAGLFVSRNVSDPYAAARLLTFLHSTRGTRATMWGREGIEYTVDENDVPTFTPEYIEARSAGMIDEIYNTWIIFTTTGIQELYANVSGLDEERLAQITAHGRNVVLLPEIGIAAPSSASDEGIIRTRLDELRRVHEPKIIFTDTDEAFEAAYQEFMEALVASGVEEFNEYMTNAIRRVREDFGW